MRLVSKEDMVEAPVTGKGMEAAAAEVAAGGTTKTMGMPKMVRPSTARMPGVLDTAPTWLEATFIGTAVAAVVFTMQPTSQVREKTETILHTWGGEQPEEQQDEIKKLNPERERFSLPHASRDPRILKDRNLGNEDIFEIIRKPQEVGAVRIFENPEFWDMTIGLTQVVTTQGISTIQLP